MRERRVAEPTGAGLIEPASRPHQPEIALFALLDTLPLANVTSVIGLVLIVVFFVTSSDSGSLVIDTITAGGKLDAPPVAQRVFWCVLEGLVAIALLLGGGLVAAQAASRPPAFPLRWCWSPCATAPGRGCARARRARSGSPCCAVGSMRGSREDVLASGGERQRIRDGISFAIHAARRRGLDACHRMTNVVCDTGPTPNRSGGRAS